MRTSLHKNKILKLLSKRHLLTIAQIHKAIPKVDYSTIFRNVEQLLKAKLIKRVLIDNKSVAYESSKESHDHFICNDCGKVEEIHVSRKDLSEDRVVSDITARGICGQCKK
jgi:Fe2+ or Zn2+ uptake regulation protein